MEFYNGESNATVFVANWVVKKRFIAPDVYRSVAVKQIQLTPSNMGHVQSEIYLQWYLSQSQYNKHFIKFWGWYKEADKKYFKEYAFIVMEKADYNLREYINKPEYKHQGLTWKKDLIVSITQGVQVLHSIYRIAHRDIKPENILLVSKEKGNPMVKLCDFGISRAISQNTAQSLTKVAGSPYYIAPDIEIAGSENQQVIASTNLFKADIWALGKLIYFICVQKDMKTKREAEHWYNVIGSEPLDNIMKKCLFDDPDKRFEIDQLYQQLQEAKI